MFFLIFSLPSKYIDPVTMLPYHNSVCFKIMREAYYQQLDAQGNKSLPLVANWSKWYHKNRDRVKRAQLLRQLAAYKQLHLQQ